MVSGLPAASRAGEKPEQARGRENTCLPAAFYSIGICIIARKPLFYSRGRAWAEPTKKLEKAGNTMPLFAMQKNKKRCIKTLQKGIL